MVEIAEKNQRLLKENFSGSMRYDMKRNLAFIVLDGKRIIYQAFFYFSPDDGEIFYFSRNNPPKNCAYERGNLVIDEVNGDFKKSSRIVRVSAINTTPEYIGGIPSLEFLERLKELPQAKLPEATRSLANFDLGQRVLDIKYKFSKRTKAFAQMNLRGTVALYNRSHADLSESL